MSEPAPYDDVSRGVGPLDRVVRWVRGRSTWWIPLVAVLVGAAGWAIGAFVTFSAVG